MNPDQNKIWGLLTYAGVIVVAYLGSWVERKIRRDKSQRKDS